MTKIKLNTTDLLRAITPVQEIAAKTPLNPEVIFKSSDRGLTLQAQGGGMSIKATLYDCNTKGIDFSIGLTNLSKLLQKMATKAITLKIDQTSLELSGSGSYLFPVQKPETTITFPPAKNVDTAIIRHLKAIRYAVADDIFKPSMAGIHFTGKKAVATDSFQLAEMDFEFPVTTPMTVPTAAIDFMLKYFQESDMSIHDHTLYLESEGFCFAASGNSDTFPNYSGILPDVEKLQAAQVIKINAKELHSCLERLTAFESKPVVMTGTETELTISTVNPETSLAGKEVIQCSATGLNAKFNPDFVKNLISTALTPEIEIYCIKNQAFYFESPDLKALAMGMKV